MIPVQQMMFDLKPPTPPLDDAAEIERIIEETGNNAGPWVNRALFAVREVASQRHALTSDDVWDWLGDDRPPNTNRSMGPVMVQAAKAGLIRKTNDRVKSKQKPGHFQPITIWESLVFK